MGLIYTDKITVEVAKYGEGSMLKNLLKLCTEYRSNL